MCYTSSSTFYFCYILKITTYIFFFKGGFNLNNTFQQYIDDILGERIYILNTDSKELVFKSNSMKNISSYNELIKELDVLCLLPQINTLTLNKIYKKYHFSAKHNLEYLIKYKLVELDGESLLVHSLYDITQEVNGIKTIQDKLEVNKAIIKCANTLLKDSGAKTNIRNLLEIVCNFYHGSRANLFLFNDNDTIEFINDFSHDDLLSINAHNKGSVFPASIWPNLIADNNFYTSDVYDTFSNNPVQCEIMKSFKISNLMASAIQKNGENIGFITIDNPEHRFTDFDLLDTATIFLANNIERQLFERELEFSVLDISNRFDESEFILKCAEILFQNKDINKAMELLLHTIADHYSASRCSILEYTDNYEVHDNLIHLKMTYEYNSPGVKSLLADYKDKEIHQDVNLYNKIQKHKCVYTRIEDLDISSNSLEFEILYKNDVKSAMVLPIRKNNKVIAILLVQNPTTKLAGIDVLFTISGFLVSELSKRDIVKELEHLSFSDKLTGLFNRNYYLKALEVLEISPPEKLGVIFADINGLKRVNDNLGHEYGDAFIRWCGDFLKRHSKGLNVFRIGGDEFICLVYNMDVDEFFNHIKVMRDELHKENLVNMSMGGTFVDGDVDINQQIVETDKIMYNEKQKYYILKKLMNVNVEVELETLKNLLEQHL